MICVLWSRGLGSGVRKTVTRFFCTGANHLANDTPTKHELIEEFESHVANETSRTELHKFAQQFRHRIPEFDSSSLIHLLRTCKTAEYADPAFLESVLQTAQQENPESFTSVEIGFLLNSLVSLHRLTDANSRPVLLPKMQDLCLRLIKHLCHSESLSECSHTTISQLIYSLGVLFRSRESPSREVEFCIKSLNKELCQDHRLQSLSQQDLTCVVYGYRCIGWRQDSVLLLLSREIINRVHGFLGKEISSILLSFGALGYYDERLVISLGIEASGPHRAASLSEQELSNVLHGITQLISHSPALLLKLQPVLEALYFESGSVTRLTKYNKQDLGSLLYDFSKLWKNEYNLQKPWIRNLTSKLVDQTVLLLSSDSTVLSSHSIDVFYACARMQYPHIGLLKHIHRGLRRDGAGRMDLRTVSLLLWGMTRLGSLNGSSFLQLCGRIMELREQGVVLTNRNWVQLTQASQFIQQSDEKVEISPKLKDLLEEASNEERNQT
eukprot:g1059.t1